MSNITILTACNKEYLPILKATNIVDYAKRHSYDIHVFNKEDYFNVRGFKGWVKVLAIRELLRTTKNWIFWIDVDSVITNPAMKLEEFINEKYDMIIGKFYNDPDSETIYKLILHTGGFLIRQSEWIDDMVSKWYNCDPKFHEGYKYAVDEGALLHAIKTDSSRIKVLPQATICTTSRDETENDFIVHLAAWYPTIESRLHKIKELRIKYHV